MFYNPIVVVAGEPYSIFTEIFFKAIKKNRFKKPIILIISKKILLKQMKELNFRFKINVITKNKIEQKYLDNKKINIINVDFDFKKTFSKITDKSNSYISSSFKIAIEIIKKNKCAGLINGPISKKNFLKEKHLGITEYLTYKTGKQNNNVAMLIFNKKLSVSPLTTHLPLKEVHKNISKKKIINHVKLISAFYKKKIKKTPKIAITGLNPHCESNYKSSEEKRFINPAIKDLIKLGYDVDGPYPADTIFIKNLSKKYDVIIGMYHDQVLTPIKALLGFKAINITLGLQFIRVSPDHGPNEKMLGLNKSNPLSLINSIKFLDK